MQSQGMNGIATPKRSMRRPQCAELDDLYVPVRHGQLIIVRTESAGRMWVAEWRLSAEGIHSLSAMVTVTFFVTVSGQTLMAAHIRPGGPRARVGPVRVNHSGYRRWPGWMLSCPFRLRFPDLTNSSSARGQEAPAPQDTTHPGKIKNMKDKSMIKR